MTPGPGASRAGGPSVGTPRSTGRSTGGGRPPFGPAGVRAESPRRASRTCEGLAGEARGRRGRGPGVAASGAGAVRSAGPPLATGPAP